jgi:hypothetical protein
MSVRAKFKVDSIERLKWSGGQEVQTVKLTAVYQGKPGSENTKFWQATPSGSIQLTCVNPEAVKQFELGGEMYIDFTPVPPPEPAAVEG